MAAVGLVIAGVLVVGFIALWVSVTLEDRRNTKDMTEAQKRVYREHQKAKGEEMKAALRARRDGGQAQIVCPHCQTRGGVTARATRRNTRLGVRKTGAAILTLGASAPLTGGISKKQSITEMRCSNCGMSWTVDR